MTATVTIQNADSTLIDIIRNLLGRFPSASLRVEERKSGFYGDANIRHLEELKRLDDAGKLNFVTKSMDELKAMEQ